MEIRRFFVDKNQIIDDIINICGDEFLHLTKVLRHKVGYKILVANDYDNNDYLAEIIEISKDFCRAKIIDKTLNLTSTTCQFDLYQAMPKGDKLDLIVQKAVELGVNTITPFMSANVAESRCNAERLSRIALEASKQCGRAKLAKVNDLLTFEQLKEKLDDIHYDLIILPSEHECSKNLYNIATDKVKKIAVVIGSEGGFKQFEVEQLVEKVAATPITLGNRILRCETAAIATLAIVTYKLGEMRR